MTERSEVTSENWIDAPYNRIGFVRKYEYEEEDDAVYEDMTIGYWRVVERD